MNIHTYVEDIPEFPHEHLMIALWEESWRRLGWNPLVLTRADALRHPLARALQQHVSTCLPTVNHPAYELACYLRWCSLAIAGGGWMSDYDVINYSLRPEESGTTGAGHLWFGMKSVNPRRVCPCLVHGGTEDYERAIRLFLDYRIDSQDLYEGRPHTSDQQILSKNYPALYEEGWIRQGHICSSYRSTETEWQNKATVHYSNKYMRQGGKIPRHDYISLDPAIRVL